MKRQPTKPPQHQLLIRLPRPVHRELREKAKDEARSVSAHVRYLIEQDLKEAA